MSYISLTDLKSFGSIPQSSTTDDSVLQASIDRACMQTDAWCGTNFSQQSVVNVQPLKCWVDSSRTLSVIVREHAPVSKVSSITYRDLLSGSSSWETLSWNLSDLILPYPGSPPDPRAWMFSILGTSLSPHATGQILVRVSYTGGYALVPDSLKSVVLRLAWWDYKLREAPLGRVINLSLGTIEVPIAMPLDIKSDLNMWRRIVQ